MSGKTISVNSQVLRWNEVLNRWSLSELEVDNNTIDLYNTEEGILETFNLSDLSIQQEEKSQKISIIFKKVQVIKSYYLMMNKKTLKHWNSQIIPK